MLCTYICTQGAKQARVLAQLSPRPFGLACHMGVTETAAGAETRSTDLFQLSAS